MLRPIHCIKIENSGVSGHPLTKFLMDRLRKHDVAGIKAALVRGAAPNRRDLRTKAGETALMLAVQNSSVAGVKWLLNNGANTNLRNEKGDTALDYLKHNIIISNGFFGSIGAEDEQK